MEFRYPGWLSINLSRGEGPEQALTDWAEGTALAEQESNSWAAQNLDSAECSYVDRCLAEMEDLLRSLDAYTVDH
jgi:hypothetical protein